MCPLEWISGRALAKSCVSWMGHWGDVAGDSLDVTFLDVKFYQPFHHSHNGDQLLIASHTHLACYIHHWMQHVCRSSPGVVVPVWCDEQVRPLLHEPGMAAREGSDESPAHTYQCPQCCRRATKWHRAYHRKGLLKLLLSCLKNINQLLEYFSSGN